MREGVGLSPRLSLFQAGGAAAAAAASPEEDEAANETFSGHAAAAAAARRGSRQAEYSGPPSCILEPQARGLLFIQVQVCGMFGHVLFSGTVPA